MPAYNASPPSSIGLSEIIQVWKAEQPVIGAGLGSASQQVAAAPAKGNPLGITFIGFFSGAPGTFEIDVQGSFNDVDAQYQTLPNGNITTVDTTNQTFLFEDSAARFPFYRALMRARANAVNVTASFGR